MIADIQVTSPIDIPTPRATLRPMEISRLEGAPAGLVVCTARSDDVVSRMTAEVLLARLDNVVIANVMAGATVVDLWGIRFLEG